MTRRIALLALAFVASARFSPSAAQDSASAPASMSGDEGALDNDAFLPFNGAAAEQLARGDVAYAKLVARARNNTAIEPRAWTEVFDAWRAALLSSRTGDIVPPRPRAKDATELSPWPDPDGTASQSTERRGDGVEYAVLRRLYALDVPARALWNARFDPLAALELGNASNDAAVLAHIERDYPATNAAARAAIALCELEFERAQFDFARAWLGRARRHVALTGDANTTLAAAVERRVSLLASIANDFPSTSPRDAAWMHANQLKLTDARLVDDRQLKVGDALLAPGMGVRPGLAFLNDKLIALQGPGDEGVGMITLIELERARAIAAPFQPDGLLPKTWVCGNLYRPRDKPGWPLLPAARGDRLVLVHGRQGEHQGNALLCVTVDVGEHLDPPRLPRLRWAVHDGVLCDSDGRLVALPGVDAELGVTRIEFQPGPLLDGSTVYAISREFLRSDSDNAASSAYTPTSAYEIRSRLWAFEFESGALRWQCELGKGTEVQRPRRRFLGVGLGTASAQPPVRCGEFVFAGTHTGLGSLVEALDGRVAWTLKNRRRGAEQPTWSGARPAYEPGSGDGSDACVLWAPADSDHVYWLRAIPDLDGRGLMLHPPRASGDGEVLIGGDAREALVLAHAGSQRTLNAWNAVTGGGTQSPELGPAEIFAGEGLCSAQRAFVASNRNLYLFDRTRELYLLDDAALVIEPPALAALSKPGGSLWARGDRVCVLGLSTLWIFSTR